MSFSVPGLLVGLLLLIGVVLSPVRAFQACTGRLAPKSARGKLPLGATPLLFVVAFVFWLAVAWATYNIEVRHACSGDTCIGYMLLGLPFPFVYGLAELKLFRARRASTSNDRPRGGGAA